MFYKKIKKTAKVSVVIPLFNHERYIRRALESVFEQGDIVSEIIVVDDGSRDRSAAIVTEMLADQKKLIFWSHPNRGAHATINAAVLRATAEYVAILNSDDVFAPARLDRLTDALEEDGSVDLVASSMFFIDGEEGQISNPWHDETWSFYRSSGDIALALVNGNFLMTTSNFVVRRQVFERCGGFAPLRYAHDLDFLLRLCAYGAKIKVVEERLLGYRIHATNTIKENQLAVRQELAIVLAQYIHLLLRARSSIEWGNMITLTKVLERHSLVAPVHFCMMHLQKSSSETLERSLLLNDQGFKSMLSSLL